MFKAFKGGLRRASGGGQTGRISGLHGLRGSSTEVSRRRRPAFVPDSPEQQATDGSKSSGRVTGTDHGSGGYTGKNL